MSQIKCRKIKDILTDITSRYGWSDYSFTFIKSIDWSNPNRTYVMESSPDMALFYEEYKNSGFTYINNTFLRNDLPHVFTHSDFGTSSQGLKLEKLFTAKGWLSGLTYTTYGYDAAMGLIAFQHRDLKVDADTLNATINELNQWRGQFNAWARKLIDDHQPKKVEEQLSTREIDCMALVAEGKTSVEIANALGITKRTVDFHINNAMLKLGGSSRSQAAMMLFLSPLPHMAMVTKFDDSEE